MNGRSWVCRKLSWGILMEYSGVGNKMVFEAAGFGVVAALVDKVVEGAAVCIVGVVAVFIIGKEVNVRCKI